MAVLAGYLLANPLHKWKSGNNGSFVWKPNLICSQPLLMLTKSLFCTKKTLSTHTVTCHILQLVTVTLVMLTDLMQFLRLCHTHGWSWSHKRSLQLCFSLFVCSSGFECLCCPIGLSSLILCGLGRCVCVCWHAKHSGCSPPRPQQHTWHSLSWLLHIFNWLCCDCVFCVQTGNQHIYQPVGKAGEFCFLFIFLFFLFSR